MAVKPQNPAILLRRPLPPKVLSPLPTRSRGKNGKRPSYIGEICQRKDQLAAFISSHEEEHQQHVTDVSFTTDDVQLLCKPQGPDPLPARPPKHGRDNPYELPVHHRFIHSPMFTLDDFLRKWEEVREIRAMSPDIRKLVREKKQESWAYKQLQQQEVYRQVYADNEELPNPLSRKPQRQIIIELAAAILSNEGEMLDKKLTEILNQVEAPKFRPPRWTLRESQTPRPPLDVSTVYSTLEEWSSELSFTEITGASDIANFLTRNRRPTEAITEGRSIVSNDQTCPHTEVLISRSSMLRSQGRAPSSQSPFNNDETLTPAEFVVFDATVKYYSTLDLKGYFISQLPDIQALTLQLTVVNLSFNKFVTVPPQIFSLKNLISLNLRDNPLKEIPFEIVKLSRLRTLIISFCLISTLPLSLFTLEYLKVLDVSYNSLSFIPKEISKLRSLVELSVEGNELGAFPAEFLNLQLKYFRMMNNFTHPLFWKQTTSRQPQRLFHLAAQVVVSNSLFNATSDEIKKQLIRPGTCDCCDGPIFGPGVKIIKPIPEIFDIKNLPLSFAVCSQTCRRAFKKDQQAIDNWLKK